MLWLVWAAHAHPARHRLRHAGELPARWRWRPVVHAPRAGRGRAGRRRSGSPSCATGSTRSSGWSTARSSTWRCRFCSSAPTRRSRSRWVSSSAGGSDWVVARRRSWSRSRSARCGRGVQDLVDRRFSRARYEGVRRVRDFEEEVREGRREPEEIVSVLAEALRDPLATLFFWLPASETYADASGELVADAAGRRARALRDRARGSAHRRAAPRPGPAREAGPAARRPRGGRALDRDRTASRRGCGSSSPRSRRPGRGSSRRATRSAGASSATCTTAHSSGSSRSASRSGASSERCRVTASILSPALDQIVGEVGAAIADLRQIAAGVRPARLDDGLAAALRDLASSSPVPVDVEAPSGARRRERRGCRLLRRVRGAHERGEARVRLEGRGARRPRERRPPAHRLRRRDRRRGRPSRLGPRRARRTGSPRTAGRSRS